MTTRFEPTSPNKWATNAAPCSHDAAVHDMLLEFAEEYVEYKREEIQNKAALNEHIRRRANQFGTEHFNYNTSKLKMSSPVARTIINEHEKEIIFWVNETHDANQKRLEITREKEKMEIKITEMEREILGLRKLLAQRGVTVDLSADEDTDDDF